jgi:hypothetical protein
MEKIGFPPTDPLCRSVNTASEPMSDLSVDLNYLSCVGGIGRIPSTSQSPPESS